VSDYPATQRSKPEPGPAAATRCSCRPAGARIRPAAGKPGAMPTVRLRA